MQRSSVILATAVGLLVTAALVLAIAMGQGRSATAQEDEKEDPAMIHVTGEGLVEATPDIAYVNLGVRTQAPTAEEAQRANAEAVSRVIARLKALGVAEGDIQTSRFNLRPLMNYEVTREGKAPEIVGFAVDNIVMVTLRDLELVGEVIDAGIAAGANTVEGVRFAVEDPSELELEALRLAVEDARRRAEVIAEAAGVRIARVREISTTPGYVVPFMEAAVAEGMRAATVIIPGSVDIRASVSVSYELE